MRLRCIAHTSSLPDFGFLNRQSPADRLQLPYVGVWLPSPVVAGAVRLTRGPAPKEALVVPALEAKRVRPAVPGLALIVHLHSATACAERLRVHSLQDAAVQPVAGMACSVNIMVAVLCESLCGFKPRVNT